MSSHEKNRSKEMTIKINPTKKGVGRRRSSVKSVRSFFLSKTGRGSSAQTSTDWTDRSKVL